MRLFTCIVLAFILQVGNTQDDSRWEKFLEDYKIQANFGFQLWSTYSMGMQLYNTNSNTYVDVDDRWNHQLKRSRISIKGQPYKNIKFNLTASIDHVGRDALSSTQGGNNNGGSGQFGLWNMFVQWKILNNSDALHVTTGYQPAQFGRENINPALAVSSFEKSWSQNYQRRNINGKGHGRSLGINIGGQQSLTKGITVSYDFGVYSPLAFSSIPNSKGIKSSPLITERVAFYFGDPESKTYTTGHKVNYLGKRKGLTIGLSASQQGETDLFSSNAALCIDWLFNWGMVNFDGDWSLFSRKGENNLESKANGGYARFSLNIPMKRGQFIEPVFLIAQYNGALKTAEIISALSLATFAGRDEIIDMGLNYHINPKLKVSLFYTINNGDLGNSPNGATFNNYFVNSNRAPIKRGNVLGLGTVVVF